MSEIKSLNSYIWKYKSPFITSNISNFLATIPVIIIPFIMGLLIDEIYGASISGQLELKTISYYSIILISMVLLLYILNVFSQFFSAKFNGKASAKIRSDVFREMQIKSLKFYDDETTGDLVSKSIGDVAAVINYYQILTQNTGRIIGRLLFTMIVLFYFDTTLGIVGLVSIPIMLFISFIFRNKLTNVQVENRRQFGKVTNLLTENVDNAIISKVFNSSKNQNIRINKELEDLYTVSVKRSILNNILNSISILLPALLTISFFYVGGTAVIENKLTLGNLITILFLGAGLAEPINQISTLAIFRGGYKGSEKRLISILSTKPQLVNPENGLDAIGIEGVIEFKNVNFGYTKDNAILNDINLKIEANSTVAMLGASGSGKSAMINLIPRFYDAWEGMVLIDGINVAEYDYFKLRKQIGFVDQETFLFSRTIKENIAFGKVDAPMDEIIEVAKAAQIHSFIDSLPEKYETLIGERGVNLSGGQRQRLSIARALLYDPKIIIFDDSLSAVDIKTEHAIQKALDELLKNRTVIFVTQRLSTVSKTDKNIVLGKGRVLEEGSHEELLALDGKYKQLYETQIDGIMDLEVLDEELLEVKS